MKVIINGLHVEVHSVLISSLSYGYDTEVVSSLEDAYKLIDEEPTVLAGFIYDNRIPFNDTGSEIYFASNIGYLPEVFNTVDNEDSNASLIHQMIMLGVFDEDRDILFDNDFKSSLYDVAEELTDYINFNPVFSTFKPYEVLGVTEYQQQMVKLIAERAYGHLDKYSVYENDPLMKLLIAHYILDNVERGIVFIGSQTRTDNDMINVYTKGLSTQYLADLFEVKDYHPESNTFNMFIPSHINVLGKRIQDFIREGNK